MTDPRTQSCRHFNGIQHDQCEAGIAYKSIVLESERFPMRYPCTRADGLQFCPSYQPITAEEIAEQDREVAAIISKLNAFADGSDRHCPTCGAEVTGATVYEKYEPDTFSLYVQPCNHRQGLWSKVPAWITDVKVVPVSEEG